MKNPWLTESWEKDCKNGRATSHAQANIITKPLQEIKLSRDKRSQTTCNFQLTLGEEKTGDPTESPPLNQERAVRASRMPTPPLLPLLPSLLKQRHHVVMPDKRRCKEGWKDNPCQGDKGPGQADQPETTQDMRAACPGQREFSSGDCFWNESVNNWTRNQEDLKPSSLGIKYSYKIWISRMIWILHKLPGLDVEQELQH